MAEFGLWEAIFGVWDPGNPDLRQIPEFARSGAAGGLGMLRICCEGRWTGPGAAAQLTYRRRCEMWDSKLPKAHTSPSE
jgi:hypothetical protein